MSPETRAEWLADLAALDVGQAVESVRSMIPRRAPARSQTANRPPRPVLHEGRSCTRRRSHDHRTQHRGRHLDEDASSARDDGADFGCHHRGG
jgi:hypothetical protein